MTFLFLALNMFILKVYETLMFRNYLGLAG